MNKVILFLSMLYCCGLGNSSINAGQVRVQIPDDIDKALDEANFNKVWTWIKQDPNNRINAVVRLNRSLLSDAISRTYNKDAPHYDKQLVFIKELIANNDD